MSMESTGLRKNTGGIKIRAKNGMKIKTHWVNTICTHIHGYSRCNFFIEKLIIQFRNWCVLASNIKPNLFCWYYCMSFAWKLIKLYIVLWSKLQLKIIASTHGRNCMFVSNSNKTKNCNKYFFFKNNQIQVEIKNADQTFKHSINIIDIVYLPTLLHLFCNPERKIIQH